MANPVTKKSLLSLLILICLTSGCVERRLTIRTSPDDALVTLNDEEIGTSPVTTSFQWYADYNIRVTKPGYQTLETHQKLKAPWYDYFPFDFFAQILYPGRIVDEHTWSFDLEPAQPADRDTVIQQAQTLQQETQAQFE
ncbi:MAG: PEGA domain-containing protein [Phycisphaerae bacterium]|nr:PEGA domain-containing protein [Phycisphaerae bacterium]